MYMYMHALAVYLYGVSLLTAGESEGSAQTYHYMPALEEYCKDEDFMGKYIYTCSCGGYVAAA